MSTEEREKGAVSFRVYIIWAKACGKSKNLKTTTLCVVQQSLDVVYDVIMSVTDTGNMHHCAILSEGTN